MGLENFTDEEINSGEESESNTSELKSKKTGKPNKPSNTYQSFMDNRELTPREIKYQVKTVNLIWDKTFSMRRIDDGELVMNAHDFTDSGDQAVCVFTTIRAFDVDTPLDEQLDLWIVPWDLEKKEPLNDGTYIGPGEGWKDEVVETISEYVGHIE